jgi:hypothetical protein
MHKLPPDLMDPIASINETVQTIVGGNPNEVVQLAHGAAYLYKKGKMQLVELMHWKL